MADFLDAFILDLLHLGDGRKNKLLDLGGSGDDLPTRRGLSGAAFFLEKDGGNGGVAMLETVSRRVGKLSNNTVLENSALSASVFVNSNTDKWRWRDDLGRRDPAVLNDYIDDVYDEIRQKGNNPLFLGVGAIRWKTETAGREEIVTSPLIIFPIRLVRGAPTSPVEIEFVDDDAYFNPCFIAKLRTVSESVANAFPHPNGNGADFGDPIAREALDRGGEYFGRVAAFVSDCVLRTAPEAVFEFLPDCVAIARYEHSDLCMYYDVRRNKDKIYSHPLIAAVFGHGKAAFTPAPDTPAPDTVLPSDSVQKKLIRRVLSGESLIVKGPPGTGKTVTIANMIAALISSGKSVLLSSKKLSALCEVNAKLPERLRKFVMLMEAESEKGAANLDPSAIRSDLKEVLRMRREYKVSPSLVSEYDIALKKRERILGELDRYYGAMFDTVIAGRSYYDAIDAYMAGEGLPEIDFIRPEAAAAISAGDYGALIDSVRRIEANAIVMRGEGETISHSAWYGLSARQDGEVAGIVAEAENISALVEKLTRTLAPSLERHPGVPYGSLTAEDILAITDNETFIAEEIKALYNVAEPAISEEDLRKRLDNYLIGAGGNYGVKLLLDPFDPTCVPLGSLAADGEIPVREAAALSAACGILSRAIVKDEIGVSKALEAAERAADKARAARVSELETLRVFDKADLARDGAALDKAAAALSEYDGASGPRTFDFGARSAVKKLRALCSDDKLDFAGIMGGVKAYRSYDEASRAAKADARFVSNCLGGDIDDETVERLGYVAERCRALNVTPAAYAEELRRSSDTLMSCAPAFEVLREDVTIGDLSRAYAAAVAKSVLAAAVNKSCEEAGLPQKTDLTAAARGLIAIRHIKGGEVISAAPPEEREGIFAALFDVDNGAHKETEDLLAALAAFGKERFTNRYFPHSEGCTLDELSFCGKQLRDRRVLGAALDYYAEAERVKGKADLAAFLLPIEMGAEGSADNIANIFEHSFFAAALCHARGVLGANRAGMGAAAARNLDAYNEVCREIEEINARRIESRSLSRITPDDDDFDFLSVDSGAKMSVRGLFRNYAAALTKLKRCFIVSPSTVSTMFRSGEFFDFDVAILDEASQIEPVCLLPVLARAKQCVLVGDEYQMPPIKHFAVKRSDTIMDYDKELEIDHDISALSLALENLAFEAEELTCHYRSLTESLIAFSQREFYPHMRTFPAAVPYSRDIGFADEFTDEGRCVSGVNEAEAQKAVEILRKHFELHYSAAAGLSSSVGVVAFGEAQIDRICDIVRRDRELYEKIKVAEDRADVPEKAVFFKTIETVQGRETDHLILSLTYGRDAEGKVQNRFGELNRDELGRCIFNVAVTRAKSKVTLIHSVRSEYLDASSRRIKFIVDYLRLAENFARGGREQFVSKTLERGANFVGSVVNFLVSIGLERDRIVVNYGVTDGSIRVPVAVLDESRERAVMGLWCEMPDERTFYLDKNVGYFASLKARGWNMYRIFAHDWCDNAAAERAELSKAIMRIR